MNQTFCLPDYTSTHPLNPPNYSCLPVKYSWPCSQILPYFRTTEAHQGFPIIHQQFLINTNLTKQELPPFVKLKASLKSSNRIRYAHTNLKWKMVSIKSTVTREDWILTLYFKLPAVFKTFLLEDGVLGLAGQVFPCVLLVHNKWQCAGRRVAVSWCLWAQKQIIIFEVVRKERCYCVQNYIPFVTKGRDNVLRSSGSPTSRSSRLFLFWCCNLAGKIICY